MTKILYVRLDDDRHDYITRCAEDEGRTVAEIVRRIIDMARRPETVGNFYAVYGSSDNNSENTSDNGR
jgi:hypothetical protein